MFWYKSWRETKTIIVAGMIAMLAVCAFIIFNQQTIRDHAGEPVSYVAYIWKAVYNSFGRDLYLFLSIILGSGGLLQEQAHGTSGFTLTLPISRQRILVYRAAIGYLGVLAIAFVPAIVLPLGSPYAGQVYPFAQAVGFSLLWASCGSLCYGFAFFLTHCMEGDYSAILVAVPSLLIYGSLVQLPWLAEYPSLNVFKVITGENMSYFDDTRRVLVGPLPWFALTMMLFAATGFVFAAARRMLSRDF